MWPGGTRARYSRAHRGEMRRRRAKSGDGGCSRADRRRRHESGSCDRSTATSRALRQLGRARVEERRGSVRKAHPPRKCIGDDRLAGAPADRARGDTRGGRPEAERLRTRRFAHRRDRRVSRTSPAGTIGRTRYEVADADARAVGPFADSGSSRGGKRSRRRPVGKALDESRAATTRGRPSALRAASSSDDRIGISRNRVEQSIAGHLACTRRELLGGRAELALSSSRARPSSGPVGSAGTTGVDRQEVHRCRLGGAVNTFVVFGRVGETRGALCGS